MSERSRHGRRHLGAMGIVVLLMLVGSACSAAAGSGMTPGDRLEATPTPVTATTPTGAVEHVDLTILERQRGATDGEVIVTVLIPDTCTAPRHRVTDDGAAIHIEVWGERPAGLFCAQVTREETLTIDLGRTPDPGVEILVNGEPMPLAKESGMEQGLALVEIVEVRAAGDTARHILVDVQGSLPDACAELAAEPQVTIVPGAIRIELSWERPAGLMCAQVLRPFSTTVDLGILEPGTYSLTVNDLETPLTVATD